MLLLSQVTISSVVSVEWCVTKERLHIVWENKVFIIFWFWLFYLQKRGGEGGGGCGGGRERKWGEEGERERKKGEYESVLTSQGSPI